MNMSTATDNPTTRLIVTSAAGEERAYVLAAGAHLTIGRAAANAIVLADARASRSHARIEATASGWEIVDLGSANGTWIDGAAITRAGLRAGALVRIGDSTLRCEESQAPLAAASARVDSEADLEATLAGATLAAHIPDLNTPHLAVHAQGRTWTLPLSPAGLSIGRQAGNDLILDLPRVSRRHARIEPSAEGFRLIDAGSSNGTFIGGRPVQTWQLRNGDTVQIGEARLVFKQAAAADDLTLVEAPAIGRRSPVVIVPGLMGSQLWRGSERVWPSVRRLFTEPDIFCLPDGPELGPRGIVDEMVIVPNLLEQEQYGRLTQFLEEALGYARGVNLLEFAYDWRQDVRISARKLAAALDAWPASPPFTLIAHSLGCLVSRFYIERLGGHSKVGRLLLLGGPHYGAPRMVSYLFKGVELLPFGLMGERLRDVVATFPTSYQILPTYACVFDQEGRPVDLLHDETWLPEPQRGLLRLAREFRQQLGDGCRVPAVSIFGYGLKTLTSLQVTRDASGAFQSLHATEEPGGDATVPETSTVLAGSEIHPVEQAHGSLYVDQDVKMRLKLELLR